MQFDISFRLLFGLDAPEPGIAPARPLALMLALRRARRASGSGVGGCRGEGGESAEGADDVRRLRAELPRE